MKARVNCRTMEAMTLLEVLAVIAVILILFMVFTPAVIRDRAKAPRIKCVNNLRQIGLSFRIFATDHNERFPMEVPVKVGGSREFVQFGLVAPHFLVMSNELSTPKLLACPKDKRLPAANFSELQSGNISYFVGLDARQSNPQSLLAGDRNITNGATANDRILFLTTNQPVGWTKDIHQHAGDVLMADGHVEQVSNGRLRDAIRDSNMATNRLAMP